MKLAKQVTFPRLWKVSLNETEAQVCQHCSDNCCFVCLLGSSERSSTQSFVYKVPQRRAPQNQPLPAGTRPTVLLDVPKEMRASIVSYRNRYNKYLRDTSTHEEGTFDPWGLVNRCVCRIAAVWTVKKLVLVQSNVLEKQGWGDLKKKNFFSGS